MRREQPKAAAPFETNFGINVGRSFGEQTVPNLPLIIAHSHHYLPSAAFGIDLSAALESRLHQAFPVALSSVSLSPILASISASQHPHPLPQSIVTPKIV